MVPHNKKFRAYSFVTKKMSPGVTFEQWCYMGMDQKSDAMNPRFVAIMEFTGMKDEKNIEIYEGDIVKRTCLDPDCSIQHIGAVIYDPRWCMYSIDDPLQIRPDGAYNPPLAWGDPSKNVIMGVEILGNIYEHPYLLPKK